MKFRLQTEVLSNTNDQVVQNNGALNNQKATALALLFHIYCLFSTI